MPGAGVARNAALATTPVGRLLHTDPSRDLDGSVWHFLPGETTVPRRSGIVRHAHRTGVLMGSDAPVSGHLHTTSRSCGAQPAPVSALDASLAPVPGGACGPV